MAQKFGGKYSPGANPRPTDLRSARPAQSRGRANLLFLLPLPLAVRAFASEPTVMLTYLVALGAMLLAAWLTRDGLLAQEAFEARKIARRPAFPRKIFGALFSGIGLGVAGLAGHGPVEAAIFAGLGAGLHFAAFGPDPLRSKGVADGDDFQSDRVARIIEEAETTLQDTQKIIARLNDRNLLARVEAFQAEARRLFRTVENDPRDLAATRKYLTVYLTAARDASAKFAELTLRRPDPDARASYEALLADLKLDFGRKTELLLNDDHIDLEIEMNVLRERLAREGVRLPNSEE